MANLFTADNIVSFFVLVILEIVLGIDNVIFVSILISRVEKPLQKKSAFNLDDRRYYRAFLNAVGYHMAAIAKGNYIIPESWFGKGFDLASLVMLGGGLFLIYKTVMEIHHKLEGKDEHAAGGGKTMGFANAIVQIILIDAVFSFDSVITASGTAKYVEIMIAAVVLAMIVMFLFSPKIAAFIDSHPTIKMLALSFLVMIGFILIVEGFDSEKAESLHLKNYVYFAMAFSFLVELLNMRLRKKQPAPVHLHETGKDSF